MWKRLLIKNVYITRKV
jgi:hypothetical protein